MQRTFNRPHEKALLLSASYDYSKVGVDGLSTIANFVAGFDGEVGSDRYASQEVDLTVDYRIKKGWLESFWFRMRASWLNDQAGVENGVEVRASLRYDFPVI